MTVLGEFQVEETHKIMLFTTQNYLGVVYVYCSGPADNLLVVVD